MGTPDLLHPAVDVQAASGDSGRSLGGAKATYGMRQNMDITNPDFRRYSERVIRNIVEHYKDNPAVIGWQIDNETASNGASNPDVHRTFVDHLKEKFGTTDALNKAWLLNYWGEDVNDWGDMPTRDNATSTELQTGMVTLRSRSRHRLPRLAGRACARIPSPRPIRHAGLRRLMQARRQRARSRQSPRRRRHQPLPRHAGPYGRQPAGVAGRLLPFSQADQLPRYGDQRADHSAGTPPVSFRPTTASSASMSTPISQRREHGRVLALALHPRRPGNLLERSSLARSRSPTASTPRCPAPRTNSQRVGPTWSTSNQKNQVAILYSVDSANGIDYMPFLQNSPRVNMPWGSFGGYDLELHRMYGALYRLNVGVDFVFPDTQDLQQYKVIVVPPLYVASDELLNRLSEYVRNGGHLVLTLKSGFCDEFSTVRATMAPGPLQQAAGFHYQEFSSLQEPITLKGDPFHAGNQNTVSDWAEMLLLDTAKPLAFYSHPFFANYAAVTENKFGSGTLTYEGTVLSDKLQQHVLGRVLTAAGLVASDQELPENVRVKHGVNHSGKTVHYFLNYSSNEQKFPYAYPPGTELLANRPTVKGATVTLAPWEVAIVEER